MVLVVAVAAAAPAMSSVVGPRASAEGTATTVWTGSWAVAPEINFGSFDGQTLRQIVRTSIPGAAVRLHLSNVDGNRPVVVADLHVARRVRDSVVDPASDRTVTFGGSTEVGIPVGTAVVSDPVALPVAAGTDVAVSFFLPQDTGPATFHQNGGRTNYIADGDVPARQSLPTAQTTTSYYLLTNLDVDDAAAQGAVVALGASITDGLASTVDTDRRWTDDLARRLLLHGRRVGVLNEGIGANRLLTDGFGQSALNRFTQDVLAQPGVRWVIFADDPIIDLKSDPPATADQLIAGLRQLIDRAHRSGVRFLCSTLTPFAGDQTQQDGRAAYNAFVRDPDSGCDDVVDQDLATHDPADPTAYLPAFDSGDHLHPNDAGMRAIADAVHLDDFGPPAR
jgi:lysophospholipase L1-like esterase